MVSCCTRRCAASVTSRWTFSGRHDGGQSQGHQCVKEIVTIVAVEGGGHRRARARRLEAYVKVVPKLLDDGELVKETDEDLVEQGDEGVIQAAPRPGALKQYYLETFLGAGGRGSTPKSRRWCY